METGATKNMILELVGRFHARHTILFGDLQDTGGGWNLGAEGITGFDRGRKTGVFPTCLDLEA